MKHYLGVKGVSAVDARITEEDAGTFTAVASTGTLDRDGEVLVPGCFNVLPDTIKVHLDHVMTAAGVVAKARPYYRGTRLMIDGVFGTDDLSQNVRRKVAEGLIDSVSVVFRPLEKRDVKGVPTVFRAELLACDFVSIPSQPDARILSSRSLKLALRETTADARADALLALVAADIAEAKAFMAGGYRGQHRRRVDSELHSILTAPIHYTRRSI